MEITASGPYYVKSAVSGSTDLLREELTVAAGAEVEPIRVVLRGDFGTLEGKISSERQLGSVVLVAISEDAAGQTHISLVNFGGNLGLQLAPGRYKVLAVDRIDNFAYAEPEVIGKYLSKAKDVTIGPNATAHVDLELVSVGSPAP